MRNLVVLSCGVLAALCLQVAHAAGRQQYSPTWQQNKDKGYYFKKYEYKQKPADKEYKYQYVLYYKEDPKKKNWLYYYNPETKKVWCRYPTVNNPTCGGQVKMNKELWSVLPKEKQAADVYKINDDDYGKVGETCPVIPGAPDNAGIQLPPADLP